VQKIDKQNYIYILFVTNFHHSFSFEKGAGTPYRRVPSEKALPKPDPNLAYHIETDSNLANHS